MKNLSRGDLIGWAVDCHRQLEGSNQLCDSFGVLLAHLPNKEILRIARALSNQLTSQQVADFKRIYR